MLPFDITGELNRSLMGVYSSDAGHLTTTNNHTAPLNLTDKDQLFLNIDKLLKIYYSLFLVLIGTLFNLLSIVVLSRSAFRRTSTSVYLRFLACVDLFVLYNGLSRHFVAGISGYHLRDVSEGFCKFNYWSSSFGPDTSAWILVAVTTERVISIVWPHKVKMLCSKLTAVVTLVVITTVIMASNIIIPVFYGYKKDKDTAGNSTHTSETKCVPLKPEYQEFLDHVWHWIDLCKFVLLPSIILIIFNIIIIIFVIRSRQRVTMLGVSLVKDYRKFPPYSGKGNKKTSHLDLDNNHTCVYNKEMSLTLTLFVVNVTFIVCNTPVMVYFLGASYWFMPGGSPTEGLTLTASIMAMYTNNAVNFLLYCATGSKFRAEICQLLPIMSKKRGMENQDSVISDNSCSSVRKRQTQEGHIITITGSMETCDSLISRN